MCRFQMGKMLAAFSVLFMLAACGGGGDAAAERSGGDADRPQSGAGNEGGSDAIAGIALVADAGVRSLTLSWNGNGASRYDVYLSSSPGCDIASYSLCPGGRMLPNVSSPHRITGLANGRAYYAKVEGIHASGRSLSNEAGARPNNLAFNDVVRAAARAADGTTYLGGQFTRVGIRSGQGVALDTATGRAQMPGFPVIGPGGISAAVADGAGGWYIGGDFQRIGGAEKKHLARMRADGSLDPSWKPLPDGSVWSLALMKGVLYVGGRFTTINGQKRIGLAAVDAATGRLEAWNPDPNLSVAAIAAANGKIFVGGTFTNIGAFRRDRLAAIDIYGNVLPWNPGADGMVRSLAISGSTVYAGGHFNVVGNQPRGKLAAIDAPSGGVKAWNPALEACGSCEVRAIALAGSTVYVAGRFTRVGNAERNGLAAIDSGGKPLSWNPAPDGYRMHALAIGQDAQGRRLVYAGGDFGAIGGKPRLHLAALDAQGVALPWQPSPNSVVEAVAVAGSTVVAGGSFTGLGATTRNGLAAIDAGGALEAWNPNAYGAVLALAVVGDNVYAGGNFTSVGGQPRASIAKINAAGGVDGWNPGIDRPVRAFAVGASGTLYVGGEFRYVAGTPRNRLASFGPAGELSGWSPNADLEVHAIAASPDFGLGETVYVGGSFNAINGQLRRRIAQIDAQAQPTAWNPWGGDSAGAHEAVHALQYSSGTIYAGGLFAGRLGRNLAQISQGGAILPWLGPDSRVWALALSGRTLYVGGDFTQVLDPAGPPTPRNRLAAIDIVERKVTAWNPNVANGEVNLIAPAANGALRVGGSFTQVGNRVEGAFTSLAP
jgi:hypothetical protein